jgi:hypothetical protein
MEMVMRKIQIVTVVLILAAASWLTTLVDDGLGTVWTHNVVRNWEQFGFLNLHGKLVFNPGGFQADTQPQIYAGHRPASLYAFWGIQTLFSGAKASYIYYALVAAVVLGSIWQLLGRNDQAFWLGAIAVISPGYLLWQPSIDPNLTAVIAGYPFCAAVIHLLQRDRLHPVRLVFLFGLILVYSAINWTTAFIHAMLFATLLLLPSVPRKNLIAYAVLAALSAVAVVAASLMAKTSNGHGGHVGVAAIYQDYGWGNAGYGLDLSTKTAFLRLLVVNTVGLLPVIIYLSLRLWRGRAHGQKRIGYLFMLPLLVVVFELAGLRNYFGHHPWMSCNFVLLGMILAFVVWSATREIPVASDKMRAKPFIRLAALTAVFVYAFVVLLFYHIHNGQELALVRLIRANTARPAVIFIARDADPGLANVVARLPELFDRRVVTLDNISNFKEGLPNNFLLTAEKNYGYQLAARGDSSGGIEKLPLARQLLAWYSRYIAHRRAGDKMEFGDEYYLYH